MKKNFKNFRMLTIVDNEPAVGGTVDTESLPETTTTTNDSICEIVHEAVATPKLTSHGIYSTSQLAEKGITLAYLNVNREIDETAVKKKIASIKKVKGVISPCLIVSAEKCLKEGLKVHLADGTDVAESTPNLESIFVIVDGQHRSEAVRRINENVNETTKYDCFYYLPLAGEENIVVSDLLREANISTYAWKDKEYLANLIAMKEKSSSIKLDLLKEIDAHPEGKTKALVHWYTLDKSKNIYSRQIVEAMADDKKLKAIADVDPETFKMGKDLFKVVSGRMGASEAGHTAYSDWVIGILGSDVNRTKADIAKQVIQFFKDFLNSTDIQDIKELKGSREPYEARDSKIEKYLNDQWAKFMAS